MAEDDMMEEAGGPASSGSGSGSGSTVAGEVGPMMDITVKTLDSLNHLFTVPETMLVKDFKTEITEKVGIPVDQQRLIFRGRVLQDEKKISEYDVGNNTIHIVQRPSNVPRNPINDEPRPQSGGGRHHHDHGVQGGLLIAAQTGPMPNLGLRSNAATRLAASGRMLSRASALLRRMEEEERSLLAQAVSRILNENHADRNDGNSSSDSSSSTLLQDETYNEDDEEIEVGGEFEVNLEGGGGLQNVIQQWATAASAAATLSGLIPGGNNSGNDGNATRQNNSSVGGQQDQPATNTNSVSAANSGANNSNGVRRTESPRLREMAAVIESILSFNERLTPYLRHLEEVLRGNVLYENEGERDSVQYLFNNVSSILHLVSHSYHALSDMTCDFSTPPETRRLRAATAVLLETSTVVRASVPIGLNLGAVQAAAQAGLANQEMANQGNIQLQNPSNPANESNSGPGQQQQRPPAPTAAPNNTPGMGMGINIGDAIRQQLSQMLGGGNAGGILGNVGIHLDITGSDGRAPQGLNLNPAELGNMFRQFQAPQNPNQGQGQAQRSGQSTPASQGGGGSPRLGNNIRVRVGTAAGNADNNGATAATNNNNPPRFQRGPFDNLLPCNSHHPPRGHNATRPQDFNTFFTGATNVAEGASSNTEDFLSTFLDTLLQSNILSLLRPLFQDVLVSYLMRGRDPKNKDHLKSCSKKMAKFLAPFLEKFVKKIEKRDRNINYEETFLGICTEFLTEIFHLTVTMPTNDKYQFQSSIVTTCDNLFKEVLEVFRYSFDKGSPFEEAFAEYIVASFFQNCSVVFQENTRRSLIIYLISRVSKRGDNDGANSESIAPKSVIRLKENGGNLSQPSTSSAPNTVLPPAPSPEVAPPTAKVAKQSSSPNPNLPSDMRMEEDLDDLLNLSTPFQTPRGAGAGAVGRNMQIPQGFSMNQTFSNMHQEVETAMRNIPSSWVGRVQEDMNRQPETLDQPPFSPAYVALLSRKPPQ